MLHWDGAYGREERMTGGQDGSYVSPSLSLFYIFFGLCMVRGFEILDLWCGDEVLASVGDARRLLAFPSAG